MRRVLDAESDRGTVLAGFVTGLGPDDERLLRELLGQPGTEPENENKENENKREDAKEA